MSNISEQQPQGSASWMHRLVTHYREARRNSPNDTLAIVFDTDGTIIDTRYLTLHTLLGYDRTHGTMLFRSLPVERITVHEAEIEPLLRQLDVPRHRREPIIDYYMQNLWSDEAVLAAHQPYRGVMEVIRWFQMQPQTVVALNTGRPESVRQSTLRALNKLGHEYRVNFESELLFMNQGEWGEAVADTKVVALAQLRERGVRVVAAIDNEPENLEAMAHADTAHEGLFLHASTIFLSARRPLLRSCSGSVYDLAPFVAEAELQGHVQLVLSEVTRARTLAYCIDSPVHWLAVPVRADRYGRPEIAFADDAAHLRPEITLHDVLDLAADAGRSVRIDFQSGGAVIDQVLAIVSACDVSDPSLWFSGALHDLSEHGVQRLRANHPTSTISCPADFLAPLVFGALEHSLELIDVLRGWGIDRFSLNWRQARVRELIGQLERWGAAVDVTGIQETESMLQAALLLPRSVTVNVDALIPAIRSSSRRATERPR